MPTRLWSVVKTHSLRFRSERRTDGGQLGAHQQGHDAGHDEGGDRADQVKYADPLVVGGKNPLFKIHHPTPRWFAYQAALSPTLSGSAALAALAAGAFCSYQAWNSSGVLTMILPGIIECMTPQYMLQVTRCSLPACLGRNQRNVVRPGIESSLTRKSGMKWPWMVSRLVMRSITGLPAGTMSSFWV